MYCFQVFLHRLFKNYWDKEETVATHVIASLNRAFSETAERRIQAVKSSLEMSETHKKKNKKKRQCILWRISCLSREKKYLKLYEYILRGCRCCNLPSEWRWWQTKEWVLPYQHTIQYLLITFSPDNITASVIPLPLNAASRYFW